MGFILLLLFIGVPLIEIAVFIQVGDLIGLWSTISVVILTAIIGTALLRQQGFSTLMRAQASMNEGRLPTNEIFDGVCLVLAGALLLTPGFVTDTLGFLLFFPPFRTFLRSKTGGIIKNNAHIHMSMNGQSPHKPHSPHAPKDSPIIDADFEDVTPNPDSPWSENDRDKKD